MGGNVTFNYKDMLAGLNAYMQRVKDQIADLKSKSTDSLGQIDPGAMFELQIAMQTGSQYIEACSNVLSAVHQSIMKCAQAIRGQ